MESYGYKFLRINRFNLGDNPIETLDRRIAILIRGSNRSNDILSDIHNTVAGLKHGVMKECPKCGKIRKLQDFQDDRLITGYGRFCNSCKKNYQHPPPRRQQAEIDIGEINLCPQCGSPMVLREGRYGKFYGCRKFPYCRGTRSFKKTPSLQNKLAGNSENTEISSRY